jgi:hypothetical protein
MRNTSRPSDAPSSARAGAVGAPPARRPPAPLPLAALGGEDVAAQPRARTRRLVLLGGAVLVLGGGVALFKNRMRVAPGGPNRMVGDRQVAKPEADPTARRVDRPEERRW